MIGIFDSGFGGLSTLKELIHLLPEHYYIYFGDNARAPYGSRSTEMIRRFTEQGVDFLFSQGAHIVLIACNTASSDALQYLQHKYNGKKKVLGVLIPAVEQALQKSRYGRIGLIATQSTVDAQNFEKEAEKRTSTYYMPQEKKALKDPILISKACPLLVPLIEEGWIKKPETTMIIKKYLLSLKFHNIDTLILGCTHYPLLQKTIQKKMGKNCILINSGKAQAEQFLEYLSRHSDISQSLSQTKTLQLFTSGCPEKFKRLGQKFLGRGIGKVERFQPFVGGE